MRRVVARAASAVMRATALDERPYLPRYGGIQSVVQLTPLASVRAGLGEDHAPLKASSAQLALVAGLDAAVPGGCRAIDRPDVHGVIVPDDRRSRTCHRLR